VLTIFATTFFNSKKLCYKKNTSNEGDNVNAGVDVLT